MLVLNVGLRGKQKLANKWEDDIHVVLEQPAEDFPVFVIRHEDGVSRKRTLHHNMLLPVNDLPLTSRGSTQREHKPNKRKKQTEEEKQEYDPAACTFGGKQ